MPPTPPTADSSALVAPEASPPPLRLFNARSSALEPVTATRARVYVAGSTSADDADVAVARTVIAFDVLARHLRERVIDVALVREQDGEAAEPNATFDIWCEGCGGPDASDASTATAAAPTVLRTGEVTYAAGSPTALRDVLARNDAEALRYALLGTRYRAPLAFDAVADMDASTTTALPTTFPAIDDAERRVDYFYATREALVRAADGARPHMAQGLALHAAVLAEAPERLKAALDDDLDTPRALAVLGDLARAGNEIVMQITRIKNDPRALAGARGLAAKAAKAVTQAAATLGLLQAPYDDYAARTTARRLALRHLDANDVQAKVDARVAARTSKEFAGADALRAELSAMGVDVFDNPTGSTWRISV